MKLYKKKPEAVEVIQWTEDNIENVMKFLGSEFKYCKNTSFATALFSYDARTRELVIYIPHPCQVNKNDYIVNHGKYIVVCNEEVFKEKYCENALTEKQIEVIENLLNKYNKYYKEFKYGLLDEDIKEIEGLSNNSHYLERIGLKYSTIIFNGNKYKILEQDYDTVCYIMDCIKGII